MAFTFDKWEQNPLRAIFKDSENNFLTASIAAVEQVIREGERKKLVAGSDFTDFMQPSYDAARVAIGNLLAPAAN